MSLRNNYLIEKRRTFENNVNNMKQYCNKDTFNLLNANWEIKSTSVVENKLIKTKYNNFLEQKQRFLDLRRKKIFRLLSKEEEEFQIELEKIQETPEQVRKKMEEKLIQLKEQKEKERLYQVKINMQKRFVQSADELRKNDSDAFALSCYLEQENQMLDKMKIRQKAKRDDEIYDKLLDFEIKKKIEKEKTELEEKKRLQEKTLEVLEWQKKEAESKNLAQKELEEKEKIKLKEKWSNDIMDEKAKKEQERINNLKHFNEIEEFNNREMEEKKKILLAEKQNDKELIRKILDKEKALDEIDKKEKDKRKLEYEENKKYLEYVLNKKKADLATLDKIAQNEADKQWRKTQEVWIKEEQARIDLLRSVYKEREEALKYKKNLSEQETINLKKEREYIDSEMKKHVEDINKIKEEEKQHKMKHQEDLKYQIELKERAKLQEKQNKLYDERAAQLWEKEYQKKIYEQREIQLNRIREIKKSGFVEEE